MSDRPRVLVRLVLGNNHEGIREPAKYLEGAQQSVALLRSRIAYHKRCVTNDNLILPETREEKLRQLEDVQNQLRDMQYQVMEALREMEIWKGDADEIGYDTSTW
jgi:hypothetical protein